MKKLSIIVPCYNEQEAIGLFYPAVEKVLGKISDLETEYWFIDDGSSDRTLTEIKNLNKNNPNQVHYVTFSRNFGKEAALYAGLQAATGDYVVVMDVDLQDPPEYLVQMYETLSTTDYDCVGTRRTSRTGEARLKSFLSDKFYEYDRFSKGIFSWVGFKTKYLEYENVERVTGNTSWSMRKLFKYAFDGIMDFSQAPLSLAVWIGGASFILSLIGVTFVVVRHFVAPATSVFGWASLVSIILMIGGLQLLCLGIIGRYVGKIYLQVKNRPIYIVKEKK